MYRFFRDPGADGVGVAFSDATAADGSLLSLGGAHGAGGRAAGLGVIEADLGLPLAVVRQVHGVTVADADELSVAELAGTEADAQQVPGTRSTTSWGTPALDLGAGGARVLAHLGVETVDVAACTLESADLHSYRRDAAASGRQAGIIWLAGACRTKNAG